MSSVGSAAETSLARVAVIGGGLAGMAAAAALHSSGCRVSLFEARRYLGGRATSFRDSASGEWIDLCQHVSMGCCTNLADFCRRTRIDGLFRREPVLHFFAPDAARCDFSASRWLPAPLHLGPSFWRMKYLSAFDRLKIARALGRLGRMSPAAPELEQNVADWLVRERQSAAAVERFWSVVLVSALGESLERVSLSAARKVFVDGFMASRDAYVLEIPRVPLAEIYDVALRSWFAEQGIALQSETPVRLVEQTAEGFALTLPDGRAQHFDAVVLAVTWRQIAGLLAPNIRARLPWLDAASAMAAAPISGVHLWFDRPIMELDHAVLLGRTSQWVFRRGTDQLAGGYYYQVVISASYALEQLGQQATIDTVCRELGDVFPAARTANLLRARLVTDPHAVFSVAPGCQAARPTQHTAVSRLAVAGDWTDTGWPATMEGAVRSGYLAAEAVLAELGRPQTIVCPELPRSWLARWLLK